MTTVGTGEQVPGQAVLLGGGEGLHPPQPQRGLCCSHMGGAVDKGAPIPGVSVQFLPIPRPLSLANEDSLVGVPFRYFPNGARGLGGGAIPRRGKRRIPKVKKASAALPRSQGKAPDRPCCTASGPSAPSLWPGPQSHSPTHSGYWLHFISQTLTIDALETRHQQGDSLYPQHRPYKVGLLLLISQTRKLRERG